MKPRAINARVRFAARFTCVRSRVRTGCRVPVSGTLRPRLERAQTRPPVNWTDRARISGGDGSRRSSEEAYVRSCYRGTGCAPQASSASKSAAAVAFGRRTRRRGWTVTGANTDVCSLVRVGESAQAKQSAMGLRGRALRRGVWVHSASTCRNVGGARGRTRTITGMVTNRGAGHRCCHHADSHGVRAAARAADAAQLRTADRGDGQDDCTTRRRVYQTAEMRTVTPWRLGRVSTGPTSGSRT